VLAPLIAAIAGKPGFSAVGFDINGTHFPIGSFINALVSFCLVAAAVYFAVVVPMHAAMSKLNIAHGTQPYPECANDIPVAMHCGRWIGVPHAVRRQTRILERVINDLETEIGHVPDDEHLAERMGIAVKRLAQLQGKIRNGIPLVDTIKDAHIDLSLSVEQGEMRGALAEALERLPPQERTVSKSYYFERKALEEIEELLGVSESRVSQIHAQAVIRLRMLFEHLRVDMGFPEGEPGVKQRYIRR
jgi:RNA polymerase sigma factor (sigma-70 family)